MKIMYVDGSVDGHHLTYVNCLLKAAEEGSFAVLPNGDGDIEGKNIRLPFKSIRSMKDYNAWIKRLYCIAKEEKPDIIHFLDGDTMMRHFGHGLGKLEKDRVVFTYHHLFPGKLREISMKKMLHNAAAGVYHTKEIAETVKKYGCKNVYQITYPCFLEQPIGCVKKYQNRPPVLLALGGTRNDKGLDILLESLKEVKEPFHLIIAGKAEDYDEKFVEEACKSYRSQVDIQLRFLTNEEVEFFLKKADIIVLPYRKVFDGASGPMSDGIYLGKTIVGPDHGSLGDQIRNFHVGYTFESENRKSLTKCIEKSLQNICIYDETAQRAQRELQPEFFVKKYHDLYDEIIERRGRREKSEA